MHAGDYVGQGVRIYSKIDYMSPENWILPASRISVCSEWRYSLIASINYVLAVVVALIAEGMAVGVGLGVGVDLGVEV